jgi:putative tricarboxylic transport membrane protein
MSKDGWSGLAILLASLLLFGLTLGLKDNPLVPIGPGYYPRIVLAVTALLAFAVFVLDLQDKRDKTRVADKLDYSMIVSMFAVFGLYCGALPFLGFRIATLLYIAATNALLDFPKNGKGWARVAAVSIVTTIVVYYVFERYLTVLLPRGRWTDF